VGSAANEVQGVLLTLDVTEAVLAEAVACGCNLIVAHHPLIFSGLKALCGRTYVERIVQEAIRKDITIYAAHTNLDNAPGGVNAHIAARLGLQDTSVLSPLAGMLSKLCTYVPLSHADAVRDALFHAAAGSLGNYTEASFNTNGTGTFRPGTGANPTIGTTGGNREQVEEVKIEVIVERHRQQATIKALAASHPYEEVAYELIPIANTNNQVGAGIVGTLTAPMEEQDFLAFLKNQMQTDCIRHTALRGRPISRVAVCGGSGSFLLADAIRTGADIFITADFKYHQFFDAEEKIIIADIGHYESEQFTPEIFQRLINEKFPTFAVLLSNINTNPVKYYY